MKLPVALAFMATTALGCVIPSFGDVNQTAACDAALNIPLPYLWLPLVDSSIGRLIKHETPIQFRNAMYHGQQCYNVAAAFHPTALDSFGGDLAGLRRCEGTDPALLQRHAKITMAYAFAYSDVAADPARRNEVEDIMAVALGLDYSLLDDADDVTTPWGLVKSVIDQFEDVKKNDGWNADGKLAAKFNTLPFSDFDLTGSNGVEYKRYSVKPLDFEEKAFNWQPLIESDGLGYFTKQDHVTPYIGATARVHGMTNAEFDAFTVEPPEKYDYADYEALARGVIDKTAVMSETPAQQLEVKIYDSKFTSILPLQIDWSMKNQFTEFDFWFYDLALVTTMYDATVLVWREKVRYNRVRPTNVVHELLKGETVTAYGGPDREGAQSMPAEEWQPFIRTMPHAEYPSGSACICSAYADILQLLSGKDDTDFMLELRSDPSNPFSPVIQNFNKWSDIVTTCGQSRLYGGMHFPGSVPAGNDLCTGTVAPLVAAKVKLLKAGSSTGKMVDLTEAREAGVFVRTWEPSWTPPTATPTTATPPTAAGTPTTAAGTPTTAAGTPPTAADCPTAATTKLSAGVSSRRSGAASAVAGVAVALLLAL